MADITRSTTNVVLPTEVSNEIWQDASEASVVMTRARRVPVSGNGTSFQVITGDPQAAFVAEGARKPAGSATFEKKTLTVHKIAVVESFSSELMADRISLYNALRARLGNSIAETFDRAVLHGTGAPAGMDTLADAPTQAFGTDTFAELLAAMGEVAGNGGDADTVILAPQAEFTLLGAVDSTGRPLFLPTANAGNIGTVLGRPVYKTDAVYEADAAGVGGADAESLGFVADFSGDVWGSVNGIEYREYDGPVFAADGTLVHAGAQDNMSSVIAEARVGFVTRDVARHVRLIGADVA